MCVWYYNIDECFFEMCFTWNKINTLKISKNTKKYINLMFLKDKWTFKMHPNVTLNTKTYINLMFLKDECIFKMHPNTAPNTKTSSL